MIVSEPRRMGAATIVPDAVFADRPHLRRGDGPWSREADKVAWRDLATGLDCIILRRETDGTLSAFVGIPPGHPLHGRNHDALPAAFDIEVHGGLTYSASCERSRRGSEIESRSVCHVAPNWATRLYSPDLTADALRAARPEAEVDRHEAVDDAWWFGFDCDHEYDLKPVDGMNVTRGIASELAPEYRGEPYVYRWCVNLAAQLDAIAKGDPKPELEGPPPPPACFDGRADA